MKRLNNAHFGQWVDASKTKYFSFEGKVVHGLEGDSVASALLANDQWLQSRPDFSKGRFLLFSTTAKVLTKLFSVDIRSIFLCKPSAIAF